MGDAVEKEKDELLERFFAFARHVCAALRDQGHWADYIDPCSGLPVRRCLRALAVCTRRASRLPLSQPQRASFACLLLYPPPGAACARCVHTALTCH